MRWFEDQEQITSYSKMYLIIEPREEPLSGKTLTHAYKLPLRYNNNRSGRDNVWQSKSIIMLQLLVACSGGRELPSTFPRGEPDCNETGTRGQDILPKDTGCRNKTWQERHYINPHSYSLSCSVSRWSFDWGNVITSDRFPPKVTKSDSSDER